MKDHSRLLLSLKAELVSAIENSFSVSLDCEWFPSYLPLFVSALLERVHTRGVESMPEHHVDAVSLTPTALHRRFKGVDFVLRPCKTIHTWQVEERESNGRLAIVHSLNSVHIRSLLLFNEINPSSCISPNT